MRKMTLEMTINQDGKKRPGVVLADKGILTYI